MHNDTHAKLKELRNNVPGLKSMDGALQYVLNNFLDTHDDDDLKKSIVAARTRKFIRALAAENLINEKSRIEYVIVEMFLNEKYDAVLSQLATHLSIPQSKLQPAIDELLARDAEVEHEKETCEEEPAVHPKEIVENIGFDFRE